MSHEYDLWAFLFLFPGVLVILMNLVLRRQAHWHRLEKKVDTLLKAQGLEWPTLSPEVRRLANDPSMKIAAIKRLREENPGLGLAEAKDEVEAIAAKNPRYPNA